MNTSIQATLGLDTSSFSTKAKAAEKDLKLFSEGVGNITKVFTAGGTVTALVGFFDRVITGARASTDNLDENVQAVRRFGDAFDSAKEVASGFAIAAVGTVNRIGEAYGAGLKNVWAFVTGRRAAHAAEKEVLAATEAAAVAAEARLAEALKNQKEYTAVTAALSKVEADRAALRAKSLTDEEKLAAFQNAAAAAAARTNDATLTTLERRQALLDQRRAELSIEETQAVLAKTAAAEEKKNAEEMQKQAQSAAADRLKTEELLAQYAKEDADVKRRTLSYEEQIGALTRDKADLQNRIASIGLTEEERRAAIVALREKEKELTSLTADQEARLAAEAARTLAAKEASIQLSARAAYDESAFAALGRRTYEDPARQAAYEQQLRDDAQRDIDRQIAALEARLARNSTSGSRAGRNERPDLEADLRTLRQRRGRVDDDLFDPDYQDRLGRGLLGQRAEAYGDPGPTGRLEEQSRAQTDELRTLNDRLRRAGFTTT